MTQRASPRTESWTERLLIAFAAAVIAILTLVLAPFFVLMLTGHPSSFDLWGLLISKIGLLFVAVSAIVGFTAGSERTVDFFSLLWGTHELWENERFVLGAITVLIVVIGVVIAYAFLSQIATP